MLLLIITCCVCRLSVSDLASRVPLFCRTEDTCHGDGFFYVRPFYIQILFRISGFMEVGI